MILKETEFQVDLLYHFTSSHSLLDFILKDETLKFNSLKNTNDPLEYKKILPVMIGDEDPFENYHNYNSEINSFKEKLKVACFTIDDFDRLNTPKAIYGKGFSKSRLWAQYADQHRGVCIVFNKNELLEKLKIMNVKPSANKIEYSDENTYLKEISIILSQTKKYDKEKLIKSLYVKNLDFQDENEYRILIESHNKEPYYLGIKNCIKAIIIGDNCTPEIRQRIINICNERHINKYDINWSSSGPFINENNEETIQSDCINRVKNTLSDHSSEIAFILGNGINNFHKCSQSWNDLLLEIWNEYSNSKLLSIPNGVSHTEVYDLLDYKNREKSKIDNHLQKKVKEIFIEKVNNKKNIIILEEIKKFKCPILTTNFDDLIPKYYGFNYKTFSDKKFTDFYPWESYYSDKELLDPLSGFGVWYINGMIRYHRSIKLGLSHYMGNVNRARKMLHGNYENIEFTEKNQKEWPGMKSWLHILFNKSIFVIGLGLEENEVFLRWLLIERAKYYKKFPNRNKKSWYIKTKDEKDEGKDFFLSTIGFEVIEVDSYDDIYEKIWK
jgi:hypothetical protein